MVYAMRFQLKSIVEHRLKSHFYLSVTKSVENV